MINLTGTETDKNLRNAFSGESEAAMKYSFYAQAARNEGYQPVSYTHLVDFVQKKDRIVYADIPDGSDDSAPVSYTHLEAVRRYLSYYPSAEGLF